MIKPEHLDEIIAAMRAGATDHDAVAKLVGRGYNVRDAAAKVTELMAQKRAADAAGETRIRAEAGALLKRGVTVDETLAYLRARGVDKDDLRAELERLERGFTRTRELMKLPVSKPTPEQLGEEAVELVAHGISVILVAKYLTTQGTPEVEAARIAEEAARAHAANVEARREWLCDAVAGRVQCASCGRKMERSESFLDRFARPVCTTCHQKSA